MKFIAVFGFVFIFNTIKGDVSPFRVVPREQEVNANTFNEVIPKTIIISGKNGQINAEDPNVMQAVMNVVHNQLKSDGYKRMETNGNDIPEVVVSDSEPQPSDKVMGHPFQTIHRIYRLPPMMRMISTEEETEGKKSPLWRSPLPFMHPTECPHMKHKKYRTSHRKGRKQHKTVPEVVPITTVKPIVEETESPNILNSVFSSILSQAFPSGPEPEKEVKVIRPDHRGKRPLFMSISRRVQPNNPVLPFIPLPSPPPKPQTHHFIAILQKKRKDPSPLPLPFPLSLAPHSGFQMMSSPKSPSMLPFSSILGLLSKLDEPTEQKSSPEFKPMDSNEEKDPKVNFNFNVNLTVNNYNYGEPQLRGFGFN